MVDAIVSIVVEKLGSVLEKEVRLFAGARHELGKLRETFQSIEAVLADAERRQVAERGVQLWLSRLRNVAYDIGDVLDKWVISIDGSSDEDDDGGGGDGNRALVATCLPSPYACLDHTVSRFKVAQSIKDIREKLDQIDKDKAQFQFSQSSSSGGGNMQPVRIRPLTSSNIEEKMIGRVEDKETVIGRLVSGCSSSGDQDGLLQAHVIAIVGIGGLGKTTLAREIYHDGRVQSHFNKVSWVCVSEPFDVIMLMKAILEDLGEKSSFSQPNPLQNTLRRKLEGKRFLLVLDDVWNEDEGSWNQLRASLTSGAPGSRILVTTRARRVADTMSAVYIHELMGLSDEDSWGLFSSRAFAGREHEEHLFESIGREIVKKCKGVPLSIKVIGSAMNSKRTVEDWKDILGSKMWSLPPVADKILPALLLSYYNLPAHLKPCFTYCSIYEKDTDMTKSELVELWVAEGLIHSQGNREIEVVGEEYFDDLVAWSMFQEVSKDGSTCKMHDLLHDLAQFITKDETYIHTSEKSNQCPANVRHASLFLSENNPSIPSASLQAQKLRTLFLYRVDKIDATVVDLFSQARFLRALLFRRSGIKTLPKTIWKLKHLRYLDLYCSWIVELPNGIGKMKHLQYLNLSDSELVELPNVIGKLKHLRYLKLSMIRMVQLPNDIGKMKHLRYLDLSGSNIVELPESVSHLSNLHTLNLHYCRALKKLPSGTGGMVNLRHLKIAGTDSLECLPEGLCRNTCLQTLSKFIVGGEGGCMIDELQPLNSLQGYLIIKNLDRVSSGEEATKAELCNKQHLRRLVLGMQERDEETVTSETDEETERMGSVLEGLRPHVNLEKLELDCNRRSSKLPRWVGDSSFSKLTVLKIGGFIRCEQNNLPGLGKLPALKHLEIRAVAVKKVGHELYYGNCGDDVVGGRRVAAFPKLEKLVLQDIELEERELTLEAFLQLWNRPELEGLSHHVASAPLTQLRILGCHEIKGTGCSSSFPLLENFTLIDSSEFFSSELPHLPNLKEFYISSMRNETLPDGGWDLLAALRHLKIEDCNELKSLPDGLAQLQSLENLEIAGSHKLESLPEELGQLKKLQSLRIGGLEALTCLHESLGQLESLENLKIRGCPKLESLPKGLGRLKKLKSLEIEGAEGLTCLPDSLGQLQSLERLDMDGLKRLESLPDGLGHLKKLKSLEIKGAEGLTCLPDSLGQLQSLERLDMDGLKRLESLPDGLGHLKKLKSLAVSDAEELTCLPDSLVQLQLLERLYLYGMKRLESLPDGLRHLKKLKSLRINGAEALTCLPDSLVQLQLLERLYLYGMKRLESFPEGLGHLKKLQSLKISGTEALTRLPDSLSQLEPLEVFKIDGWGKLESLPHWLGQLKRLRSLKIRNMEALTCLPDSLGQLGSLRTLEISHCKKLKSMPRCLGQLKSLEDLRISGWKKLESLPHWLGQLKALKFLRIRNCEALRSLSHELQDLPLLRELNIHDCPLLSERCKRDGGLNWASRIPEFWIDNERIKKVHQVLS